MITFVFYYAYYVQKLHIIKRFSIFLQVNILVVLEIVSLLLVNVVSRNSINQFDSQGIFYFLCLPPMHLC